MLPKIFIASSGLARQVAYDIQELLSNDAQCEVWVHQFEPSRGTLETLQEWLDKADFGIFVFAEDDRLDATAQKTFVTRDNVVFEAGLFIGRIGLSRNFIFLPVGAGALQVPSDLLGITTLTFDPEPEGGDHRPSLMPSCNRVRRAIRQLGAKALEAERFDQAAAVCHRMGEDGLEFCLVQTSSERWMFPKFYCLRSEDPWVTAERAAYTVAGLQGTISKQPVTSFRHQRTGTGEELVVGAYALLVDGARPQLPGLVPHMWVEASEIESYLAIGREIQYLREILSAVEEIAAETPGAA